MQELVINSHSITYAECIPYNIELSVYKPIPITVVYIYNVTHARNSGKKSIFSTSLIKNKREWFANTSSKSNTSRGHIHSNDGHVITAPKIGYMRHDPPSVTASTLTDMIRASPCPFSPPTSVEPRVQVPLTVAVWSVSRGADSGPSSPQTRPTSHGNCSRSS